MGYVCTAAAVKLFIYGGGGTDGLESKRNFLSFATGCSHLGRASFLPNFAWPVAWNHFKTRDLHGLFREQKNAELVLFVRSV